MVERTICRIHQGPVLLLAGNIPDGGIKTDAKPAAEGSLRKGPTKSLVAAKELVLRAKEKGWSRLPFNPIFVAETMNVQIQANSNISDARLLSTERGPVIRFNPRQPRHRVRFSIAHEIAHFLLPDWAKQVRNRDGDQTDQDVWQLEMLCNLVASELVLPIRTLMGCVIGSRS